METRQQMYDEGFSILKRLENNCLLESVKKEGCVKMHDLVRDLALHITSESPRYLVKAGMQLEELPNEQEWKEDVEKVSIMGNKIKEISLDVAIPKCRKLSTLLLQNNGFCLERIHESFFTLMTGLTVLDLSYNLSIEALPNSVSELQNLNALLLHNCWKLEYVPSLSKIRGLKKLDLGGTLIKEVPHGMEMLVDLRYLDLNSQLTLRKVPAGILPKLSRLQHLRLGRTLDVKVEEVAGLRKLETLEIVFNNLEDYRLYLPRLQRLCLNSYYFHVGFDFDPTYEKYVGFDELSFCGDSILLPTDIQEVKFTGCDDITSLSDHNSAFKNATDLRHCSISACDGIECLVSSSSCYNILQSIEKLQLQVLHNFSVLFRGERDRSVAPTPTPPGMFSRLRYIEIWDCPKIEKLFWPELVHNLQNLGEIHVSFCKQLVEIISTSDDDEEMNKEEDGKDFTIIFALPKLREMTFRDLPQLKCICNHGSRMECNSLEKIKIVECPKLKRIPLLLPQPDNGQLLPPVSIRQIETNSKEWWDSLEWDHPNIKNVLEPYAKFIESLE